MKAHNNTMFIALTPQMLNMYSIYKLLKMLQQIYKQTVALGEQHSQAWLSFLQNSTGKTGMRKEQSNMLGRPFHRFNLGRLCRASDLRGSLTF